MELVIKGKNFEASGPVREYIERKVGRLDRHLHRDAEAKVELVQEMTKSAQNRYVVQITVNSRGTLLRAEQRATNINAAVDLALDVLDRQIERYKGRLYGKRNKEAPIKAQAPAAPEPRPTVVKVKRFLCQAMSPEEAAEQMELLGHDFFLFFDPESGQINVLYRRSDGDYGLIQPELD